MRTKQNTETRTQISFILTLILIGLLLPGFAKAAPVKRALTAIPLENPGKGENPQPQPQPRQNPTVEEALTFRLQGTGTLSPVIIASRTSGIAPFAVFFEGTNSRDRNGNYIGDSTTTADPQSVGLLGNDILEYTWDFGEGTENDPGGRYFSGFNAAHVYETPGTYTVTLTIRDELGEASTTIEVNAQVFEGTTYYVSDSEGEDSYDGLSPTYTGGTNGPWKTYTKAFNAIRNNQIVQPGDRVLFKRGEVFTLTNRVDLGNANNVLISAYGNGQISADPEEVKREIYANNPVLEYIGTSGGTNEPVINGGSGEISVVDIKINGGLTLSGIGGSDNMLILRTLIENYFNNVFYTDSAFFVNTIIRNACRQNIFYHGKRLALINNFLSHGPRCNGRHNIYGDKVNRGVITGTHFEDSSGSGLRIAANSDPGSWNIVVSGNYFDDSVATPLDLKTTTGRADSLHWAGHNILIERNYIKGRIENQYKYNPETGYNSHYEDIIVRNNIFKPPSFAFHIRYNDAFAPSGPVGMNKLKFYDNTIFITSDNPTILIDTFDNNNLEFFNNIFYAPSNSWSKAIQVDVASEISKITSNNNLFYFPARTNADIFWVGSSPLNIQEWQALANNPDTNSLCADDPDLVCNDYNPSFITDPPSLPEHFRLNSTSPAIDTGASLPLVYEDYDKNRRPIDGDTSGTAEWDIGAYEYGLLTLPGDFDQDGDVDMDDYAMFEEAYTGANRPVAPGYEYADLDGDGDVDLDDFSIFAANYTG